MKKRTWHDKYLALKEAVRIAGAWARRSKGVTLDQVRADASADAVAYAAAYAASADAVYAAVYAAAAAAADADAPRIRAGGKEGK